MVSVGSIKAPWWADKPVMIVGGGRSLDGFDFNRLRPFHVVAVNGSMFDIPFADCGFGLDEPAYEENFRRRIDLLPFVVYYAMRPAMIREMKDAPRNAVLLKRVSGSALSFDADTVFDGGTSGFGALNLALIKRARHITLLGFDYCKLGPGANWHHNERHYRPRRQFADTWALWASNFNHIIPTIRSLKITVNNASPSSVIEAFPRMTIEDALHEATSDLSKIQNGSCASAGRHSAGAMAAEAEPGSSS